MDERLDPHAVAMLRRNLVCTAVIRGKKPVVIVGQRKALALAEGAQLRRRWSKLKDRLGGEVSVRDRGVWGEVVRR